MNHWHNVIVLWHAAPLAAARLAEQGSVTSRVLTIGIVVVIVGGLALGVQRSRAQRVREGDSLAQLHGLLPDATKDFPTDQFDLVPANSKIFHMVRDGNRRHRVGLLIMVGSGDSRSWRTVGALRDEVPRPRLVLRRQTLLDRLNRHDIDIGDKAFDERWVVICDDPALATATLTPALREWLMGFPDSHSAPQFEAAGDGVIAVVDYDKAERIPELLGVAERFAQLLAGTSGPAAS